MSTGTSTLRSEHDFILHMLDVTEEVARRLNRGASVTPETLAGILEFLQVFADRCHHGKEEDLLFPFLERKGIPRRGGPIGVMLEEHEIGRGLIRKMAEATAQYGSGTAGAGALWAAAGQDYSNLLRGHIDKENNILFAMAERILSESEQIQLGQAFEKIELEKLGAGTHERIHTAMEKLAAEILSK